MSKTFSGIAANQVPSGFSISVAGQTLRLSAATGGFPSYTWKIQADTGTYEVTESNADIAGYDLTTTGLGSVTVAAPQTFITSMDHETTCSHVDWPVNENGDTGFMFYGTITGGRGDGVIVISQYALSATQQAAVKAYLKANAHDGQEKKDPVRFFSVETNGNTFDFNGAQVTYNPSDGKVYFDATSTWTHCGSMGYSVSERKDADIKITNDYKPQTTSVSATKVWDDANNQDGKRAAVTLHLTANAGDTTLTAVQLGIQSLDKTIAADATGAGLTVKWDNLPKYYEGTAVTYTVSETSMPDGYTSAVAGDAASGFTVTNTHTPEKTQVSVTKSWNDSDYQGKDGYTRPSGVSVQLYADGTASGDPVTLDASNRWSYTWENLDKYANGSKIVYTVTEAAVDGYNTTVSADTDSSDNFAYTVTNTPVGKKDVVTPVSLTVHKTDANTGNPLADATFSIEGVGTVTTGADGNATFEFTEPGTYAMTETVPEGYVADPGSWTITVSKSGVDRVSYNKAENVWEWFYHLFFPEGVDYANGTLTVSNQPEKVSIDGAKTWDDANDQDGKRPQSITVHLFADGTEVDSKTVTADDNWAWSFSDKPAYKDGKKIAYTVTEDKVDGYATTVSGYDVTNSYTPETTTISGTKTWDDAENQDGKRPTSITVNLLANGEKVDSTTATAAGNWAWSFTNKPVYKDGQKITYTVTEDAVADYTTTIDGTAITNTHTPETTTISGSKSWDDAENQDGLRPESITVRLLADGTEVAHKDVTAADNWSYSFDNLPVYKSGNKITYTISEDAVAGYTTAIKGTNITNTHVPAKTNVSVTKVWSDANNQDGKRPASVQVQLLANGQPSGDPVTLNAANEWKHTWTDLAQKSAGKDIAYSVREVSVPEGYTAEVGGSAASGLSVTNTHTPETTTISGSKTWDDANNQDGLRPEAITVHLLADGTEVASKTVTAADNWSWSFADMPVYAAGKAIAYTVTEDAVASYTTAVSGYNVTNKHVPQTTTISGTKTWDDADNQDGIRPDSITVNLLADGQKVASTTATAAGNWAWAFADQPVNKDGKAIAYTVTEEPVAGYTTAISGTAITNSHTPATIDVPVTKVWADSDNKDGLRPQSITVHLLADGTEVAAQKLTAEGDWKCTFAGQPQFKDGKEIAYTVTEDKVEGYTTQISGDAANGFTVTNTHEVVPPATPATPSKPATPAAPTKPQATPKTGDASTNVLPLLALGACAVVIGSFARYRKSRNSEDA